jgi:hypothetical protein
MFLWEGDGTLGVWGESAEADRIWAQVAGLAPHLAGARLFMVLQAFIDDSYDKDGAYVLAGHVASAEAWASFAAEWAALLPRWGVQRPDGRYHFKMSEMALLPERMARVAAFYRVLERHVVLSLSARINIGDLHRAKKRIVVPWTEVDWGLLGTPFGVAYRVLMDGFHYRRNTYGALFPSPENKVDFYFDNQSEKGQVIECWDRYLRNRPEQYRGLYGAIPRFEDDCDFLPLQAADLWAWWCRKWHAEGHPEKIAKPDFGSWATKRERHPKLDIYMPEDGLVGNMVEGLAAELGRPVYDFRSSINLLPRGGAS